MEGNKGAFTMLTAKLTVKSLDVDGKIILEWILKKQVSIR